MDKRVDRFSRLDHRHQLWFRRNTMHETDALQQTPRYAERRTGNQ